MIPVGFKILGFKIVIPMFSISFVDMGSPATDLLMDFKINSCISFNALQTSQFQAFIACLRPGYHVPCSRTMQRRISEKFIKMKAMMDVRLRSW